MPITTEFKSRTGNIIIYHWDTERAKELFSLYEQSNPGIDMIETLSFNGIDPPAARALMAKIFENGFKAGDLFQGK